jgi:hypothetical protein
MLLLLLSSLSLWTSPTAMAHKPIDMKIDIDGALALIEEVKAMLVKMVAIEEMKTVASPNVMSPLPPSDGQRFAPPYVPPRNRVVFKRNRGF